MILFDNQTQQWSVEQDGQLLFRQDQLFNLHRLSLVILGVSGKRFRYRNLDELEDLLAFAENTDNAAIRTQLEAVQSVLPYRLTRYDAMARLG